MKVFFISMNIKYTNDLLFDQSNIKSFNVLTISEVRDLQGPNFLVWSGLTPCSSEVTC